VRRLFEITRDVDIALGCAPLVSRFVSTWLVAGCCAGGWELKEEFEAYLAQRDPVLYSVPREPARIDFFPQFQREEIIIGQVMGPTFDEVCRIEATRMFLTFIQSAEFRKIGRCKRCGRFFYNASRRKKRVYCTGPCARAAEAAKAHQRKRREEHQSELAETAKAVKKYESLSPERKSGIRNWKQWVAGEAGPEITTNFITRAVNRGELRPPRDQS